MDEVKDVQPAAQSGNEEIEKGKGTAWLSYLGILWLVPLLASKDNAFCKFHVKQGIMLSILGVAIWVIAWIPFLGWFVGALVWLYILIMAIIGIINALSGKYWKMPLLGGLAESWFRF